jgi:hypothetical protein
MEDSESAEKQENTGIGPASACRGESAAERKTIVNEDTDGRFPNSSCAGLTRASIFFAKCFYEDGWIAGSSPGNDGSIAICSICAVPSERNPQVQEITAGAISLFPDCYLQWLVQLQRVGPPTAHASRSSSSHMSPIVVIMCFAFEAAMPTRRIHIRPSNPPPGPRPR